jgi:hypothetical protein
MSENQDEIKVYLKITGFECSPDEISNIIDINPTKTWLKNEVIHKRALIRHKENGWILQSGLPRDTPIKIQIEDLLGVVLPRKQLFQKLPQGSKIAIYCVVYSTLGRPDISLEPEMVKAIAELGAALDFDLYQLPND